MKSVTVFCFMTLVAFTVAAKYTNRFDSVNVDEVILNRKLLIGYILCVLEKGRCTTEGRELRSHVKEALENECGKCTDIQRTKTRTVIKHLINHEPEYWTQLSEKYDPERKYVKKYESELKAIKA